MERMKIKVNKKDVKKIIRNDFDDFMKNIINK
jgi:hypothetical protein